MNWQVIVPGDGEGALSVATTVEANTWFDALRSGLSIAGLNGQAVSNVTCDVQEDGSYHVTDFVSRKVYFVRPLAEGEAAPGPQTLSEPAPGDPMPCAGAIPHKVFLEVNEDNSNGSGIRYLERLVSVPTGTANDEAARLASHVFEQLKVTSSGEGKLFISVQIFDHEFKQMADRPAVATLTWKEWSPRKTKIQFPLSGASGIRLSMIFKAADDEIDPQPTVAATIQDPEPLPLVQQAGPVVEQPQPEAIALNVKSAAPKRPQSPELQPDPLPLVASVGAPKEKPATRTAAPVIEDAIVHAFEKMQDVFHIRQHDEAAGFALDLCREFVDCEAGCAMLITPGRYELYVAAAHGEASEQIKGKSLSLNKGIVGFAAKMGTVVIVSDPQNDPRFHKDFDQGSGFTTRCVLATPIQHEGRLIGAIELLNSPRPEGFNRSEADVVSYIAGSVGEFISNSLPSREKEFSEREFAEFVGPNTGKRRRPASKRPGGKVVAQKKTAGAATSKPVSAAKIPAELKATIVSKPSGKKNKKRKKKR